MHPSRLCCCSQFFSVLRAHPGGRGLPCGFPVFTGSQYVDVPRALVVAWKERSRKDISATLAVALADVLMAAVQHQHALMPEKVSVQFVAVPTRLSTRMARGGDPLCDLLHIAAGLVRHQGLPCEVRTGLLRRVRGTDQVGLSAHERFANAERSYRIAKVPVPGTTVVLVDDIVTTGATLATCRSLLSDAGVHVAAAATLCATKVWFEPMIRRSVGTPTG